MMQPLLKCALVGTLLSFGATAAAQTVAPLAKNGEFLRVNYADTDLCGPAGTVNGEIPVPEGKMPIDDTAVITDYLGGGPIEAHGFYLRAYRLGYHYIANVEGIKKFEVAFNPVDNTVSFSFEKPDFDCPSPYSRVVYQLIWNNEVDDPNILTYKIDKMLRSVVVIPREGVEFQQIDIHAKFDGQEYNYRLEKENGHHSWEIWPPYIDNVEEADFFFNYMVNGRGHDTQRFDEAPKDLRVPFYHYAYASEHEGGVIKFGEYSNVVSSVYVHFTVNGGMQLNYQMTKVGAEYTSPEFGWIGPDDTIDYWFTVMWDGMPFDTPIYSSN